MDFIIEPGNQPEMAIFSMAACVSWGVLIFCITSGSFNGFATSLSSKTRQSARAELPRRPSRRRRPARVGVASRPAGDRRIPIEDLGAIPVQHALEPPDL